MAKPQLPAGLRDFGPEEVYKRQFIFERIRKVFEKYGFDPIETPAFETSQTLTEKYGEEGDQLLYRILKSGDFLNKVPEEVLGKGDYKQLLPYISDKGMRYDLTVPLARYVAMNSNAISFPFKRYQFQPVWRADKPQKGRYREFYQCDADVIGSDSLLYEAEMIALFDEVFEQLGINKVTLYINNRKILYGLAEKFGFENQFTDFTIALDKLDKVGLEGVRKEMRERNIPEDPLDQIQPLLDENASYESKIDFLSNFFPADSTGQKGIREIEEVNTLVKAGKLSIIDLNFDLTLARGLDYYTGMIYEAVPQDFKIGSIASGGRYDDLTSYFGLSDVSGIGISFGVERIYDLMDAQGLFPDLAGKKTQVMVVQLTEEDTQFAFGILSELRDAGVSAEITPNVKKMGKQLKYADKRQVHYALLLNPADSGYARYALKTMETGEQADYEDWNTLLQTLRKPDNNG